MMWRVFRLIAVVKRENRNDFLAKEKLKEAQKAMNSDPANGQALLDEALALYDDFLLYDPNSEVAHYGRAQVLQSQNKVDEAIAAMAKSLELYPEFSSAMYGLIGIYFAIGDIPSGEYYVNMLVNMYESTNSQFCLACKHIRIYKSALSASRDE